MRKGRAGFSGVSSGPLMLSHLPCSTSVHVRYAPDMGSNITRQKRRNEFMKLGPADLTG